MISISTMNSFGYSIASGAVDYPVYDDCKIDWGYLALMSQKAMIEEWEDELSRATPWWTELPTEEADVVWAPRRQPTHTKWVNRQERFAESGRSHCQSKSKAKWLRKGRA